MTCEEFVANLSTSAKASSTLRAHAETCADCGLLWRADRALRRATPRAAAPRALPPELRRAFTQERHRTRPSPFSTRRIAVLGASGASLLATLVFAPRPDLGHGVPTQFWLGLLLLAGALVAYVSLHTSRGPVGLGLAPWLRWLMIGVGVLGFELWARAQARIWPPENLIGPHSPARDCLLHGSVVALLVGVVLFVLGRRSALVGPRSAGALGGCVAGFAALLSLHAHCPAGSPLHLQLVHALPLLLAVVIGSFAGRRWLAI